MIMNRIVVPLEDSEDAGPEIGTVHLDDEAPGADSTGPGETT
jgi:hypothetical protein